MIVESRGPSSIPVDDRATGCHLRGDRAPMAVFGPFPLGRVGGRPCRFCSGRVGGRRDIVDENRVGVGGRPGTPGPVGGPDGMSESLLEPYSYGTSKKRRAVLWTLKQRPN